MKKMKHSHKRLIIGAIGGFVGGGLGAVAGSADTWINMLVGAFEAAIVVFLINSFFGE